MNVKSPVTEILDLMSDLKEGFIHYSTSFFFRTCWKLASTAIFFTKSLVRPANGNSVCRKASWEIWLRKNVWSFTRSAP